jgi:hypothetical protein
LLARLSAEYGFTFYTVPGDSPAGRRLAQWSKLPFLPGIYVDMQLIAYGRPSEGHLRRAFEQRFAPQAHETASG